MTEPKDIAEDIERCGDLLCRENARLYALVRMITHELLEGHFTAVELLAAIPLADRAAQRERERRAACGIAPIKVCPGMGPEEWNLGYP